MPKQTTSGGKGAQKPSVAVMVTAVVLVIALVVIVIAAVQMARSGRDTSSDSASQNQVSTVSYPDDPFDAFQDTCDYVRIEMEDGGIILLELYPQDAPITVANFKKLVSEGFYNGVVFHRISKSFVIQGGDPEGTGYGGAPNKIKGEFSANGVNNPIGHKRGVLSMARASYSMDSASSQFFICLNDSTASQLDGQYAAFGRVVSGMAVVDAIAALPVNGETPLRKPVMKSVTLVREASANSSAASSDAS